MPPVDLEALVSVCGTTPGDRKIACETLADDDDDESPETPDFAEQYDEPPPDFPAESFWLSEDAEFEWFDRNAFLERKESTRGNINSTNPNSNSERFSRNLKPKAGILGLPNTHKNLHTEKPRHVKPPIMRLFPSKRSGSIGKSMAPMTDPTSPNVSCIGRVKSKSGRGRKPAKSTKPEKSTEKRPERTRSNEERGKKKGFYSGLMSLFRSDRRCQSKAAVRINEPAVTVKSFSRRKSSTSSKRNDTPVSDETASEPPGLGGMTRFVSGRRSESWVSEKVDVAKDDSVEPAGRSGSYMRL